MSFCVEDVFVEGKQIWIVTEQEEEVLECFCKVERLHVVLVANMFSILNVTDGSVAVLNSSVLLERVKDLLAPLSVHFIARRTIQVHETFHCFRSLQVVVIRPLNERTKKTFINKALFYYGIFFLSLSSSRQR